MSKKCIVCGQIIPEGRLKALPGVQTCVEHSTSSRKKGIVKTVGEGDHTYNDLDIVDEETFRQIEILNAQLNNQQGHE